MPRQRVFWECKLCGTKATTGDEYEPPRGWTVISIIGWPEAPDYEVCDGHRARVVIDRRTCVIDDPDSVAVPEPGQS